MVQGSTKSIAAFPAHQAPGREMVRAGQSLLDRIGNTPLLRFDRLTAPLPGVTLLGKAEWYNPGGSVKDRAAANIVAEGRRNGKFTPGKILLDATSGNTGIAYAMLGAAEGFPVTLCMPTNVSVERKKILQAYGARIPTPIPAKDRMAPFERPANSPQNIQICISTPISTPTMRTGKHTITGPQTRSGNRPKDALLTLSPCSEPAALSWAPLAV